MSLASALAAGPTSGHKKPCLIVKIGNSLPPQEAEALTTMLNNPDWGHETIAQKLRDLGHPITGQTLGRHRSRRCLCL